MSGNQDEHLRVSVGAPDLRTVVLLAGIPAVGLGLSRFGYALILPEMSRSLEWSNSEAGLLNAANAIGYLAGAVAAARFGHLLETPKMMSVLLAAVLISTGAMALPSDLLSLMALRILGGAAAALVFVAGATLAVRCAPKGDAAFVLSIYCSGAGLGIALSGLFIPGLAVAGEASWRVLWIMLAAIGFVPALVASFGSTQVRSAALGRANSPSSWANVSVHLLAAYFLFGLGYIGYMTFVLAAFVAHATAAMGIWTTLGLAALFSPLVWKRTSALTPRLQLSLHISICCIATVLPLSVGGGLALVASAILFGGSFFAVVAAVAKAISETVAPAARTRAFGLATVLFGVGQAIGPIVVGFVGDLAADLRAGLFVSAGMLALAAVLAYRTPSSPTGAVQ